jgi:hypothetical protein
MLFYNAGDAPASSRDVFEDLRAAIADATFAPADVAALDASLHQVLNGWSLSVSRSSASRTSRSRADAGPGGSAGRSALGDPEDVFRALEPARRALGVGNRSPRPER